MLRSAWFLARMDVKYMLRARETLLWTFFMPVVFFFFIGNVTGGFARRAGPGMDPLVLDADPTAGFLAGILEQNLKAVDFELIQPTAANPPSDAPRLAIPPGFTDSVLAGRETAITLTLPQDGGLRADYDKFRVQRAAFTVLGNLVAATEEGRAPSPEGLSIVTQAPRPLTLEVTSAGTRKNIPTGFEQAVPGTMVMFTLIVLLTSGAIQIVIERQEGLLRRLASSPMRRVSVLLGKWAARMILGLIQIAFAMGVGTLLFHVRWGPNLPMLLLVLVAYASLVAFLGMLLGSLARTEGQAVGIGVITANVFGALGGCWWPIEITPAWMQKLALVFPTGWAMDALHKLVSFGAPPQSVVPHLIVFLLAITASAWGANRIFRFA